MKKTFFICLVLLVGVTYSTNPARAQVVGTIEIGIYDSGITNRNVSVPVPSAVVWRNYGTRQVSLSLSGYASAPVTIAPGQFYAQQLNSAGTLIYTAYQFCNYSNYNSAPYYPNNYGWGDYDYLNCNSYNFYRPMMSGTITATWPIGNSYPFCYQNYSFCNAPTATYSYAYPNYWYGTGALPHSWDWQNNGYPNYYASKNPTYPPVFNP